MSKKMQCNECNGTGISPDFTDQVDNRACERCGGSGEIEVEDSK